MPAVLAATVCPPMDYDVLVDKAEHSTDAPPGAEDVRFGGVHIKKYAIPKGMLLVSHCHVYDHPSVLASGEVELWTQEGGIVRLVGPTEVKIAAGVKHALTALSDAIWYCIHAERGDEPPVITKE